MRFMVVLASMLASIGGLSRLGQLVLRRCRIHGGHATNTSTSASISTMLIPVLIPVVIAYPSNEMGGNVPLLVAVEVLDVVVKSTAIALGPTMVNPQYGPTIP